MVNNNIHKYTNPYKEMSSHTDAFRKSKTGLCKESKYCAILAKALVWEARGEALKGMEAVGYTILNRVADKSRWPSNIYDVIKQEGQFSFWKDRHKQKQPTEKDWEIGHVVAYDVINRIADNPIGKSNHYHSIGVNPKWAKKMEFVAQIGNHKFYKY